MYFIHTLRLYGSMGLGKKTPSGSGEPPEPPASVSPIEDLGLAGVLREPLEQRATVQAVERELHDVAQAARRVPILAVAERDGPLRGRRHESVLNATARAERAQNTLVGKHLPRS